MEEIERYHETQEQYWAREIIWAVGRIQADDTLWLYVETTGDVNFMELAKKLEASVKSRIGFTPLVKVVEVGVLPRSEKKTKRVIDERYE